MIRFHREYFKTERRTGRSSVRSVRASSWRSGLALPMLAPHVFSVTTDRGRSHATSHCLRADDISVLTRRSEASTYLPPFRESPDRSNAASLQIGRMGRVGFCSGRLPQRDRRLPSRGQCQVLMKGSIWEKQASAVNLNCSIW